MAIEIVDLAIKNGGSFRSYVKVYQTVYIYIYHIYRKHREYLWVRSGVEFLLTKSQ